MQQESSIPLEEAITIQNAGLVILNVYFTMLFERLHVVQTNTFVSDLARINAMYYLQYLV